MGCKCSGGGAVKRQQYSKVAHTQGLVTGGGGGGVKGWLVPGVHNAEFQTAGTDDMGLPWGSKLNYERPYLQCRPHGRDSSPVPPEYEELVINQPNEIKTFSFGSNA
jgi:hypothetical protein